MAGSSRGVGSPAVRGASLSIDARCPYYRKGIRLIFLNQERGYFCGDTTESSDVPGGPGKSSLFFLTALEKTRRGVPFTGGVVVLRCAPESVQPERGPQGWESTSRFGVSGAPPWALEKLEERLILTLGRTHNRSRSPR